MSNRKTTFFYALLIAIASLAVGMVIASRLDLSPESAAQTIAVPAANSAPLACGASWRANSAPKPAEAPVIKAVQPSKNFIR